MQQLKQITHKPEIDDLKDNPGTLVNYFKKD